MSIYEDKQHEPIFQRYISLKQGKKCIAEYVWIGGNGQLRSKARTLDEVPKSIKGYPEWNFDGSSTNQAPGDDSEVWLKPVKAVPDPFRGEHNKLVLCECYNPQNATLNKQMEPIPTNRRYYAKKNI